MRQLVPLPPRVFQHSRQHTQSLQRAILRIDKLIFTLGLLDVLQNSQHLGTECFQALLGEIASRLSQQLSANVITRELRGIVLRCPFFRIRLLQVRRQRIIANKASGYSERTKVLIQLAATTSRINLHFNPADFQIAGELLLGAGIPIEQHNGPMREIAPGWKLRVLLAQALFSNPDVLLLDEPTNNLDIDTIRWLEDLLNERNCTMIIISHDRHFLNSVCTHMADVDYGEIRIYPGNYDDYMLAATESRARLMAANAKSKERVAELQEFVRRFAANKSKAKQATSRRKLIDKIQSDAVEVRPSSRQNPFIRFEQAKPLYRQAVHLQSVSKAFDGVKVLDKVSLMVEAGEKIAIVGPNGAGKSTLVKTMVGAALGGIDADEGLVKWAENAAIGYMAQDVYPEFEQDVTLTAWLQRYAQEGDDDQALRSILGRLLFSGEDVHKAVKVLSGGEKHRMTFGRLMLQRSNVLIMDEPSNHLDMESIESLQLALEKFQGTLFVVSHDREFVNAVATRIWAMKADGRVLDFQGSYEEFLASQGVEG
ncbi:MAG: ATP-binding cassette domain-containing protein [Betaproteobacteria bacterium]|nr:ATP-binding cassette domain-containing protein [Betaproteobacteria bacterium]